MKTIRDNKMVRAKKLWVIMDTFTWSVIDLEYFGLDITEEDIDRYNEENPMPIDPSYMLEDFKADILKSVGAYLLHPMVESETAEWVAEFVHEHI